MERRIPVLMYHEVSSKKPPDGLVRFINKQYVMNEDNFKKELEYFHIKNYRMETVSSLKSTASAQSNKAVILTFDDGYSGNYTIAFNHLKHFSFKATFFIVTDWVGKPYMMNWEQIKEMSDSGMEIGSHTCSHVLLETQSEMMARDELKRSKQIIEDKIGKEVKSISYPNGSHSPLINKLAVEEGYVNLCTSDFGYLNSNNVSQIIPRIAAVADFHIFIKIVDGELSVLLKKLTSEYIKKILRLCLGRRLYSSLYFKFFGLESM